MVAIDTRKPVDEDCIAFLSRETLRGIAYMHSQGKIHRDIKVLLRICSSVPTAFSYLQLFRWFTNVVTTSFF